MGQGQEVHARRLMGQFIVGGGWVLLQNCHLSLDYILEAMDQVIDTDVIHDDFRLWLTTEVHPKFPITFLQVGGKQIDNFFLGRTSVSASFSMFVLILWQITN